MTRNYSSKRRVLVYLRKSDLQGRKKLKRNADEVASIGRQREACRRYCERHGYTVVDEFADQGISGVSTDEQRPAFQQMKRRAAEGDVELVVVWLLNRITRSKVTDSMAELRPLELAGVNICTTDREKPIDWDDIGELLRVMLDLHANHDYSVKISLGALDGQWEKAREGRWVAGRPPIGYVQGEDDFLELGDAKDVETVQWMFQAYASGEASLRQIVEELQVRGRRHGVSWVRDVLRNRLYVGDFVWNRKSKAKLHTLKDGDIQKVPNDRQGDFHHQDGEQQVLVLNAHPPIIERELFEDVQDMFEARKRKTTPHRNGGKFLLTGICRCGDCGAAMVGWSDGDKVRMRCGGALNKTCDHDHLCTQEEVIKGIVRALHHEFANVELLDRLRKALRRKIESTQRKSDLSKLEAERAKLQKRIERATQLLLDANEYVAETLHNELSKMGRKVKQIDKDIERVTTPEVSMGRLEAIVDNAQSLVAGLETALLSGDVPRARGCMLRLVRRIDVNVSVRKSKTGNKKFYTFEGGEIALAGENNLFSVLWRTKQVLPFAAQAISEVRR